ncbi:hypothetical protein CEXT_674211 [Caerostris extrusa]|uniref:Uncharacterized protein n=1 Tax=Caerostris extrusa TaxID=172846 RepID=A0AAV4T045_CAEEX|nr:hypothetical protein CEXT_674211 [Caerostris extrusa]
MILKAYCDNNRKKEHSGKSPLLLKITAFIPLRTPLFNSPIPFGAQNKAPHSPDLKRWSFQEGGREVLEHKDKESSPRDLHAKQSPPYHLSCSSKLDGGRGIRKSFALYCLEEGREEVFSDLGECHSKGLDRM